jgi:hypothetical protein
MTHPLKITRLHSVDDNAELSAWIGDPEVLIFGEAEDVVADWCRVSLDAVEYRETGLGEFFFVHDAPVAFLVTEYRVAA